MKKINILLSTLVLAVAMLTPMSSFAEGDTDTQEETTIATEETVNASESIEVSQTYKPSYKIVIPAGTAALTENQKFIVKGEALLEYSKSLTVSVESENEWKLKDIKHDENEISYKMKCGEADITTAEADILTVKSGGDEYSVTLTAYNIGTAYYAGTYKDVLTFKAKTATPGTIIVEKEPAEEKPT